MRNLAETGTSMLVLEEVSQAGSMGARFWSFAEQGIHDAVVSLMGIEDRFIEHGDTAAA